MNAAFLLVTTAWLAGDTAAAKPAPAAPAANACSADCCDRGCGHQWGSRLRDCLQRCFHRNDCCDPCPAPRCHAPRCHTRCETSCEPCCNRRLFHCNFHRRDCCERSCTTSCDPCGHGGHRILDRLRNCFHRNDCCDPCGGTTVVPKSGETIVTPPKKMPAPSGKEPPAKEIRYENAPTAAPAAPAIQAEPQNTPPAIVPGVSNDNLRSPF